MEALKECAVCFCSFDTKERVPRFLPCGHTLCSQCLANTIKQPTLRRCPFHNQCLNPYQNSADSFPMNYALLGYLEQKHRDTCKIHEDERLKLICFTDKRKLCSGCVKSGEHHEHSQKD